MINGIDGCKKGWFVFSIFEDDYSYQIVESLEDIREFLQSSSISLIDIPLGLENNKSSRICDKHLKEILKRKASSIFNAPVYDLLDCSDYKNACEISYKLTGKKISIQTWNIIPKIKDANCFVRNSINNEIIREFHPETGFLILNKYIPLKYKKREKEGIAERIEILNRFIDAEKYFAQISSNTRRIEVAKDDILDAMCCAVNAKFAKKFFPVPQNPDLDKFGIKKEIILTEI